MRIKQRLLVLLVCLGVCGAWYARVTLGDSPAPEMKPDPLRTAAQATVRLIAGATRAGEFRGQTTGTGIILSSEGVVLTTPQALTGFDGKLAPEVWAALVSSAGELAPPHRAVRLNVLFVNAKQGVALLQMQPRDIERVIRQCQTGRCLIANAAA